MSRIPLRAPNCRVTTLVLMQRLLVTNGRRVWVYVWSFACKDHSPTSYTCALRDQINGGSPYRAWIIHLFMHTAVVGQIKSLFFFFIFFTFAFPPSISRVFLWRPNVTLHHLTDRLIYHVCQHRAPHANRWLDRRINGRWLQIDSLEFTVTGEDF